MVKIKYKYIYISVILLALTSITLLVISSVKNKEEKAIVKKIMDSNSNYSLVCGDSYKFKKNTKENVDSGMLWGFECYLDNDNDKRPMVIVRKFKTLNYLEEKLTILKQKSAYKIDEDRKNKILIYKII